VSGVAGGLNGQLFVVSGPLFCAKDPLMRFSLSTLILITLWIGAVIAVVLWHKPWQKVSDQEVKFEYDKAYALNCRSPDGTRECVPGPANSGGETSWAILDRITKRQINLIWVQGSQPLMAEFIDNDSLQFGYFSFLSNNLNDPVLSKLSTYHRRFPEWWWGHFYRPEVWCAIVLTALLAWRFAKRKQMTINK
jgi:hypothetical protein